jgi:excisionase family DNA binding protein
VTPTGLLALLAVLEPAQPARLGVAIEQPPIVRVRGTTRVWIIGVAVRHRSSCPPPLPDDGGARPLGGLEHRAGAASWATGRQLAPDAPTTSYLARRIPSTPAKDRHHSVWRDEPATARENPAGRPPWGQMTEELLTQQQLADELQVSVRTLERWRQEGTGPAFVRVGRSPRYRRSDIDAWLERQRRSQGE